MSTVSNTTKALLTRREAAAMLGVKTDTLAIWSHLKKGPVFHKIGRTVRYKLADLEAFVELGRRSTSEQK